MQLQHADSDFARDARTKTISARGALGRAIAGSGHFRAFYVIIPSRARAKRGAPCESLSDAGVARHAPRPLHHAASSRRARTCSRRCDICGQCRAAWRPRRHTRPRSGFAYARDDTSPRHLSPSRRRRAARARPKFPVDFSTPESERARTPSAMSLRVGSWTLYPLERIMFDFGAETTLDIAQPVIALDNAR
jgi:hypothetical protein